MATITIAKGASLTPSRQIVDRFGNVFSSTNVSPFLASDTLTATVSTGESYPSLFAPTAAWTDATGIATYQLTFTAAQTATLNVSTYYGQTRVQRGSDDPGVVDNWELKITRAPGTDVVPLTFTTTQHLRQYAPWIESLQSEFASAGFVDEQLRATNWMIDLLCNCWKTSNLRIQQGQPGWNQQTVFTAGVGDSPPSFYLRQQISPQAINNSIGLNGNATILGNVGNPNIYTALLLKSWVVEACAKVAISYICAAQVPREDKGQNYWAMADRFARDAENICMGNRAEVDLATPQTGWASITIHLGATSLR